MIRRVRKRARVPAKRRDRASRHSAKFVISVSSGLMEAGFLSLLADVPEIAYLASSSSASGTANLLAQHRPDVLLIDSELAGHLHADYPDAFRPRVLLVSTRQHMGAASICAANNACGLVHERAPLREIRASLRTIAACDAPKLGASYCMTCPLRRSLKQPALPLSPREHEVFERIGLGMSNCTIAAEFCVSVKTVETQRENIKRKLGLASAATLKEAASAWHRGEYVYMAPAETRRSLARKSR